MQRKSRTTQEYIVAIAVSIGTVLGVWSPIVLGWIEAAVELRVPFGPAILMTVVSLGLLTLNLLSYCKMVDEVDQADDLNPTPETPRQ